MSNHERDDRVDDFGSTCWSVVLAARDRANPRAQDALAELCGTYWYPLYAYIRRSGHSSEDGHDLTQGFFATVIAEGFLNSVTPEKGKFRAYLLACCRHYLSDHRRRERARKRGGGQSPVSIDRDEGDRRYRDEPWHQVTPERLFERRWALALLDHSLRRLDAEIEKKGQGVLYQRLRPALVSTEETEPYARVASDLGLSEGAVKVHAHRLRRRYGEIVREEIGRTVDDPALIEDEVRELLQTLSVLE